MSKKLTLFKVFDDISESSKKKIEELPIIVKNYDSNEVILREDSNLTHALYIEKGYVKTSEYLINGKEIVSAYYSEGDAFPFYLYFGGSKKLPYDIFAVRKTTINFIPLKEFEKIMDEDIVLTKNVMKFIAEYTVFNKLVIRATQYSKVEERLSYRLLHMDEVEQSKKPTTQGMFADILRVNRPGLNQEIKKLISMNVIRYDDDYEILDRKYLEDTIK